MSDIDHVRIGKQARRHNYYELHEFIRTKATDTALELGYHGVGMMATEDFIVGLQEGLEAEVGEASAVIMYQCGLEWGRLDMQRFETRFEQEWGKPMRAANVNFMLETWWWPLTASGWGAWHVDLGRVRNGYIVVDLYNSAVAQSLEIVGKPVCHLYAGMLAGAMSVVVRKALSSIEIQCYAMGEDNCRFLIASEQRVDAAEFWLNEGARADEIIRRMESQ